MDIEMLWSDSRRNLVKTEEKAIACLNFKTKT